MSASPGSMEREPTPDAVNKLATLVRIATVSHRDPARNDTAAFDLFLTELARLFPLLHAQLELTRIHTHGLLFRWAGSADTRPVVLMAHLDVVPVDGEWAHEPFGADIVDGQIWGRGTLDDKGSLVGICEAVESLLADGFTPAQDVWLSFGCDEEVMGQAAPLAVEELRRRDVNPWFVLDEGGAVAGQAFPGVSAPIGVVGVSEKGVVSLELSATGAGGHASTPARRGPTARIARAVHRLDRASMPASVSDTTVELLRRMAPHAPLALRPVLTHAGRARGMLTRALLAAGPETAAMTRTTVAVTTLSGSPALNVVAARATAGVNIRVMLGDTVTQVIAHVRKTVNDSHVSIDVVEQFEPSPLSPIDDDAFAVLESTIADVFPDAVPAPYVMMAATDSRYFTAICDRVYRFVPLRMSKAQRQSIHAADEHVGVDDFLDGVHWYRRLIEGLT